MYCHNPINHNQQKSKSFRLQKKTHVSVALNNLACSYLNASQKKEHKTDSYFVEAKVKEGCGTVSIAQG